jgi:hypothetical protein
MDTFNADIEAMTATAREAFLTAQAVIDAMSDGERIQIKDLAKKVGQALSEDPKDVLGFVSHFAHNTSVAYVTRGKNGGVVKGTRPVKVIKAPKKVKDLLSTPITTSTDAVDGQEPSDIDVCKTV